MASRQTAQYFVVGGLLVAHFATRLYVCAMCPDSARNSYLQRYGTSLSLVAGLGNQRLALAAQAPEAQPLIEFLKAERAAVSHEEIARFKLRTVIPGEPIDQQSSSVPQLDALCALDIWIAAALWKAFGVRWDVYYLFYALVSAAACATVWSLGKRLSGRSWVGLIAGVFFTCSPIETVYCVTNVRDISPLWVTAFGFRALVAAADRISAARSSDLACFVAGLAVGLGTGYRADPLLLAPCFVVALGACAIATQRAVVRALRPVALMVAGLLCSIAAVHGLRPTTASAEESIGLHMAAYGEHCRLNLTGVENELGIAWDDAHTSALVSFLAATNGQYSDEYAHFCMHILLAELHYNAFHWLRHAPELFWEMLHGWPKRETLMNRRDEPVLHGLEPKVQGRWMAIGPAFAGAVLTMMPWLFLVGAIGGVVRQEIHWGAVGLFLFGAYYGAVLFLVLPMHKHLGMLQLPLILLAALGVNDILTFMSAIRQRRFDQLRVLPVRRLVVGFAVVMGAWVTALGGAWLACSAERGSYIADIEAIDRTAGRIVPTTPDGKHVLAAMCAGQWRHAVGLAVTIETGERPEPIVCRQERVGRGRNRQAWDVRFTTRHQVQPNSRQEFFVVLVPFDHYREEDRRSCYCSVALEGDARIVECRQLELPNWRRLPFVGTVSESDRIPGGRYAGRDTTSTEHLFLRSTSPRPGSQILSLAADGVWDSRQISADRWMRCPLAVWSPIQSAGWQWASAGDFDGDGFADVCGIEKSGQIWVGLMRHGSMETRLWTVWPCMPAPQSLVVADFDGDGRDDIAGPGPGKRDWLVAISRPQQQLADQSIWIRGAPELEGDRILAADVDGDRRADLVGYCRDSKSLVALISDGLRFAIRKHALTEVDMAWNRTICGDFNGDQAADLLLVDRDNSRITVLLATPVGWQRSGASPLPQTKWGRVVAGDFDGDGRCDIAGLDSASATWTVGSVTQNGIRHRHWGGDAVGDEFGSILVGDFDADGLCDMLGRNRQGSLLLWQSTGSRFEVHRMTGPAPPADAVFQIDVQSSRPHVLTPRPDVAKRNGPLIR